jgi:putative ABC transport system permease protein
VVVVTLGVGIGATTAIFSVINGVLLQPLPYDDAGDLVQVWEKLPQAQDASVSYPNFVDWREQNTSFEELGAFKPTYVSLSGDGDPERLTAYQVSASLFTILRAEPHLGRSFLEEEDRVGAPPVVVLSHSLWQSRFGSDPDIVGRVLELDDRAFTVVGVMPEGFRFPPTSRYVDLWTPIGQYAEGEWLTRSNHLGMIALGRLKPGVSVEQARTDMEAIAIGLEEAYPDTNNGSRVNLASFRDRLLRDAEGRLLLLFAAVAFVLLIACVNVANLLLARGGSRQREIAIRWTMGASRARIVSLLVTEAIMLSLLGGLVGLLFAEWAVEGLSTWLSNSFPRVDLVHTDGRVLAFAFSLSLTTGIGFGLIPAVLSARNDPEPTLKQGGRTTAGRTQQRVSRGLVLAEITLAQALLIVAGLMIRSLAVLVNEDTGMDPHNVLTLSISLPDAKYPELAEKHAFFNQLLDRVQVIPGVISAAAGGPLPLTPVGWQSTYEVDGEPSPAPGAEPVVDVCVSTPDLHSTLGIPLLRGRFFTNQDTRDAPPVAIIDETFAERHWPNANPIGKRVRQSGRTWEIVGVVGHVSNRRDSVGSLVQMYTPLEWDVSSGWSLAIRTAIDPTLLIEEVRSAVLALDPDRPIYDVRTMEGYLRDTTASGRVLSALLAAFALTALLLASVGIYGVMSYSTNERRPEVGIRMALGATSGQILRMLVRQGAITSVLGVLLGLALSLVFGRLISDRLYGVTAADLPTFLAASVFLGVVAILASYVPARRILSVEPATTLQSE